MISRVPSVVRISTTQGTRTARNGSWPTRMPTSPSLVRAMTDVAGPSHTRRSAATTSTCSASPSAMDQPSFWILSQFSMTMSMPPTLKNACSAMWSTSPSQIILNDSMVSASGTVEPGTLVNFSAM